MTQSSVPTNFPPHPLHAQGVLDQGAGQPSEQLHHFFESRCDAQGGRIALICSGQEFTYAQLEQRANRLANFLVQRGVRAGDAVGILLERSVETYVALLAVLKAGAAYVPLDVSFPAERIAFMAGDASMRLLISSAPQAAALGPISCPMVLLDESAAQIEGCSEQRLPHRPSADGQDLAYIIYTSGTTGRPKGVAISHANICNFLRAALPIYDYHSDDRVYQGMTIAFDFSIEEIWPTLATGAALVAGPPSHDGFGPALADFLIRQRVTVLCCVPTLLATLDRDVPSLRLLLVGGEPCSGELVRRWANGRRMLNTYGPTETTVTATWTPLLADRNVTIGKPLPTYSVHLLQEQDGQLSPAPAGAMGEICIGGPGVGRGYVNRPELTGQKFIPDPFSSAPGARLYRTGDLGRRTTGGEIEFLGRLDTQVKIRGHRIELGEIEAVLLEDSALGSAVVVKLPQEASDDLAAYVTLRQPGMSLPEQSALKSRLHAALRQRLPAYMVPAHIEILAVLPSLPSGKADRNSLPPPASPRLGAGAGAGAPPATPVERLVASAWKDIFRIADISVDADFFMDLGGHSLFAAAVISALRKNPAFAHLAVADLYTYPTIRFLAQHLSRTAAPTAPPPRAAEHPPARHTTPRVLRCGLIQFAATYLLMLLPAAIAAAWTGAMPHPSAAGLLRAFLLYGPAIWILTTLLLPVAGKWLLVWRFRPGRFELWSWYYCRWWLARKLLTLSPLHLLAGSPLLPWYARLLGARIGPSCHIATGLLELPDLIEIGSDASIGYGAVIHPFVVEDGYVHQARIRIGNGAMVGTNVVLMSGSSVEALARVADQSLVAEFQVIPAGQTWAGSPSSPAAPPPLLEELDRAAAARQSDPQSAVPSRRHWSIPLLAWFVVSFVLLELLPFLATTPGVLLYAYLAARYGAWQALPASLPAGAVFVGCTCFLVAAGKRLAMPHAREGVFVLRSWFGLRKWVADKLMEYSLEATNALYATLYAVGFLRLLGADVGRRAEVSTVSHVDPDLLSIGSESFLADIATVGPAAYDKGWVALGCTRIGHRSFVGNAATIPGRTTLGDDSLIGVQSVPPAHTVAAGTSWLGSPAIFLPRRQASQKFDEAMTFNPPPSVIAGRLAIELLRIVIPSALMYAMFFADVAAVVTLNGIVSVKWQTVILPAVFLATGVAVVMVVALLKWMLVGRYHGRVEPQWAYFVRRSELATGLYESAAVPAMLEWATGTPFLPAMLRWFGAKMGRRVFLETNYLTEFDLVSVADDAQVGMQTSLQTHLFEDRVMKMSDVHIGAGATIGPRSVVLYDSTVESGAHLDALSLVMKGERLPAEGRWRGVPARPVAAGKIT